MILVQLDETKQIPRDEKAFMWEKYNGDLVDMFGSKFIVIYRDEELLWEINNSKIVYPYNPDVVVEITQSIFEKMISSKSIGITYSDTQKKFTILKSSIEDEIVVIPSWWCDYNITITRNDTHVIVSTGSEDDFFKLKLSI